MAWMRENAKLQRHTAKISCKVLNHYKGGNFMTFTAKYCQDQRKTAPPYYPGGAGERLTRSILDHHVNTRLTSDMLQGSFQVHYDRNAREAHTAAELALNVVYVNCTETQDSHFQETNSDNTEQFLKFLSGYVVYSFKIVKLDENKREYLTKAVGLLGFSIFECGTAY